MPTHAGSIVDDFVDPKNIDLLNTNEQAAAATFGQSSEGIRRRTQPIDPQMQEESKEGESSSFGDK